MKLALKYVKKLTHISISLFFIIGHSANVYAHNMIGMGAIEKQIDCNQTGTDSCGTGLIFSGKSFSEPIQLKSSNGYLQVTLRVAMRRINASMFSLNSRGYCLGENCIYPGPTLLVAPGDILNVTIQNDLEDDSSAAPDPSHAINTMNYPNHTNLHTHGLHIDPRSDNVILDIPPGRNRTYVYQLPSDHLPGTHWYHAHRHGNSALQVLSGLVGALIVQPSESFPVPSSLSNIPSHLMVMTHLPLCSCADSGNQPFNISDIQHLRNSTKDISILDPIVTNSDNITDVYLVNGLYQPNLTIVQGEWNRFELINAVGDSFLEIEVLNTTQDGPTTGCQMLLFALDGVFLFHGPRSVNHSLMGPAARVSLGVMCPENGQFYLQSRPMGRASDNINIAFRQNLVTLTVLPVTTSFMALFRLGNSAPTWGLNDIARPHYLKDLTLEVPASVGEMSVALPENNQTTFFQRMDWIGVGQNCTSPWPTSNCSYYPFGGNMSNPLNPVLNHSATPGRKLEWFPFRHVGRLCDVEEITIRGGGSIPHPIHFHTNHFQIIAVTDANGTDKSNSEEFLRWGRVGDFRDSLPTIEYDTTIRFFLDSYGGLIMMHCHFLKHEDFGMMDRYWINPKGYGQPCWATENNDCSSAIASEYSYGAFSDNYSGFIDSCDSSTSISGRKLTGLEIGFIALGGVVVLGLVGGLCKCVSKNVKMYPLNQC